MEKLSTDRLSSNGGMFEGDFADTCGESVEYQACTDTGAWNPIGVIEIVHAYQYLLCKQNICV